MGETHEVGLKKAKMVLRASLPFRFVDITPQGLHVFLRSTLQRLQFPILHITQD